MSNKLTEWAESFKESILTKNVVDISGEIWEVGFDNILSDGVFKDLPLYNLMKGLLTFHSNIKTIHTANKIRLFINKLYEVPYDERIAFIKRLEQQNQQKIFETILIQLDRLDEAAKAEMVASVFILYLHEIIDQSLLLRIIGVIDRAYLNDLYALNQFHTRLNFYENIPFRPLDFLDVIRQNLFTLGLLELKIIPDKKSKSVNYVTAYEINNIGYCVATAIRYNKSKIPLLIQHKTAIFKT